MHRSQLAVAAGTLHNWYVGDVFVSNAAGLGWLWRSWSSPLGRDGMTFDAPGVVDIVTFK